MHHSVYELSHLQALEAESVHIIREVAAEFERPVLLFSGGKDSIVMCRLAEPSCSLRMNLSLLMAVGVFLVVVCGVTSCVVILRRKTGDQYIKVS